MSCQVSLLWSAMGWQSSLHLPHFMIALHLLNPCPARKNLLWEHICFWLSALIFWRKCLKLFTVFFSKFGCCLKSFLQNVSDGNILRKCLSSSFHTSHMVSARYLFCLTVVVNYYLCISFCVASRLWHEKHFSMGGRVSGLLRTSRGGTEEGFVLDKVATSLWLTVVRSSVGVVAKGFIPWRLKRGVLTGGDFSKLAVFVPGKCSFLQTGEHWLVHFEAWCALLSLSPDGSLGTLCDPVSP